MSHYQTIADAVLDVVRIIEAEAGSYGAEIKQESAQKKKMSSEAVISARLGTNVFRMWLNCVWDRSINRAGQMLGIAYIETEWEFRLEPESDSLPVQPPFVWRVVRSDGASQKLVRPDILEENLLRGLIRQKLCVEQHP